MVIGYHYSEIDWLVLNCCLGKINHFFLLCFSRTATSWFLVALFCVGRMLVTSRYRCVNWIEMGLCIPGRDPSLTSRLSRQNFGMFRFYRLKLSARLSEKSIIIDLFSVFLNAGIYKQRLWYASFWTANEKVRQPKQKSKNLVTNFWALSNQQYSLFLAIILSCR